MWNKYIVLVSVVVLLLTACEKEIDLGYRSIDPVYVVEGRVTNETTEVLITRTRDMEDGEITAGISQATVTLAKGNGLPETLRYDDDGYFRPLSLWTGEPGITYSLQVVIGENEFTSQSVMHGNVTIDELYFRWLKVMNERVLFCTFTFTDRPGEDNYYCYRMYRNGENYKWNVFHDRGSDGELIVKDLTCMTEQMAKDNKEEDWEDILYEGDVIEIELQTIDRRTYDYLYSVGLSERTSANPISNFNGGCLGYFSAYSTTRKQIVLRFEDVTEY